MALPKPTGRQRDVVYLDATGHQVVLGTAGTGKTVMAIHRAVHLARDSTIGHGPTLLLTFTNSLVGYLGFLAEHAHQDLTVETYHSFARGYLASRGLMRFNCIASADARRALIAQAKRDVGAGFASGGVFDRSLQFFDDELHWIDGQGLSTLDAYLGAKRIGRMAALRGPTRAVIWQIKERVDALLTADGKSYTWSGLPSAVCDALAADSTARRYRHIVIDEGQDLSPEAIRSCAAAIQPGGSLTLFCDYAQQLYGQRISWTSCGLSVAKAEPFTENHRNTAEIAKLALAMAQMPHFRDTSDLVEPTVPARAAAALPTLAPCANEAAEIDLLRGFVTDAAKVTRVGILTHTRHQARLVTRGIPGVQMLHDGYTDWQEGPGVFAGTYHSGKGLEFDVVVLPFCSAHQIPDPETVAAFGEQEAAARESRLLYVGVTRAKRELLITYSGELTPLLPAPTSGLYTVAS